MCRSGTAYPVRILVFVQTAQLLVFTYARVLRTLCVSSYLFKLRYRLFSHTRIHREPRQWRGDPGLQYVARRADNIYWIASLHSQ